MPADQPFQADERIPLRQQAGPRKPMTGSSNQQKDTDSIGQEIPGERGEAEEGHVPVEGPGDFSQQGVKQPMEAFTPCTWGATNFQGQVEPDAIVQGAGGMVMVSVSQVCNRCPMEFGCYGMRVEEAEERQIEKQKDMLQPIEPMPTDGDGTDPMADAMGGQGGMEGMEEQPMGQERAPAGGMPQEGEQGEEPLEEPDGDEEQRGRPGAKKPAAKKPGAKDEKAKPDKKKLDASPEDDDSTTMKKLKKSGLKKEAAAQALAECGFQPGSISYYVDHM